ncbi:MAG: beta-propeller fold lactonase family protein [Candidatus Acidiferrales bacterium]
MKWKHVVGLAIAVACMASVSMAQSNNFNPFRGQAGFVYTETNGANNAVLVFNRAGDGSLTLAATVPTGGLGGGVVSVGSQGALALSQDGRWLFVANEGDGSISVMERTDTGLKAVGKVSTGGTLPVSIAVSRNLVYVLNDGVHGASPAQPASITGFFFDYFRGTLVPIPNSTRSLSVASPTVPAAGPIAAEIGFDNSGLFLYVTEVGTSLIDTYTMNFDGTPSEDRIQKSFGDSPFAFAFDPRGNLLVTEVREQEGIVGTGAVTSYQQDRDGILYPISGSVPDSQTAPCWIAITPDGRYAYAVNTASAVISGYQVGFRGEISLLGNGVTAQTAAGPLDNAFTRDGRYLYDVTAGGTIAGFQVHDDGSLTSLNLSATVPPGSRGLVVE